MVDDGNPVIVMAGESGSLRIFKFPLQALEGPILIGVKFMEISKLTDITAENVPSGAIRDAFGEMKQILDVPLKIFPSALVVKKNEPEIGEIMCRIGEFFPGRKVIFQGKEMKLFNCTCSECTRCGHCNVCFCF